MEDDDYFRRQAAESQQQADRSISDFDRAAWLRVAQSWLALIRHPRQSDQSAASDKFDAAEKSQGTNQERSEGEH